MRISLFHRLILLLTVSGSLLLPAVALAKPRVVTGSVAYRERMLLPPSAVVEVKLVDVSRADAPSRTIARTAYKGFQRVPGAFKLRYDSTKIVPGRRYALQARITVGKKLLFTTTTHYPFMADGGMRTDLMLEKVRSSDKGYPPMSSNIIEPSGHQKTLEGRWLAENINNRGVIDRLQSVLAIGSDGTVSGTGGCNTMRGRATIVGDKITFGALASTNMACSPAAMNQETKFFAALSNVRSWKVDSKRGKLMLMNAARKPIVVLSRM